MNEQVLNDFVIPQKPNRNMNYYGAEDDSPTPVDHKSISVYNRERGGSNELRRQYVENDYFDQTQQWNLNDEGVGSGLMNFADEVRRSS